MLRDVKYLSGLNLLRDVVDIALSHCSSLIHFACSFCLQCLDTLFFDDKIAESLLLLNEFNFALNLVPWMLIRVTESANCFFIHKQLLVSPTGRL